MEKPLCPFCPKPVETQRNRHQYRSFEEVLDDISSYGRYQKFISFLVLYATIQWAGNYAFTDLLQGIQPKWTCTDDNRTEHETWEVDLFATNDSQNLAFCHMIAKCQNLTVQHSRFNSIVQEWNLVCERRNFVLWITILTRSFVGLGAFIGGHLADWYGRKPLFFVGQFLLCLTSVVRVASQNWIMFTAIKTVGSFVYGMVSTAALALVLECTEAKHRYIPNACFIQSFASIWIALVSFLTRDWRMYLIIINLITAPVLIGSLLIHESPRWLIQTKDYIRACEILNDIAGERWNNVGLPEFTPFNLEQIPKSGWRPRFHYFTDLFATKRLRPYWRQSIMQILSTLTLSFSSTAFIASMNNFLAIDEFASIAIYGFMGAGVPIIIIILDKKLLKFGRKTLYMSSLAVIIFSFLLALAFSLMSNFIPESNKFAHAFDLIGTVVSETGYQMAVFQITVEYYPTHLRGIATGFFYAIYYVGTTAILCAIWFNPYHTEAFAIGIPLATALTTFVFALRWQTETKLSEWMADWNLLIDKVLEEPDFLVDKIMARTSSAPDPLTVMAAEDIHLLIDYSKRNSLNVIRKSIEDRRKSVASSDGRKELLINLKAHYSKRKTSS